MIPLGNYWPIPRNFIGVEGIIRIRKVPYLAMGHPLFLITLTSGLVKVKA